ncbi:histamine N-methyltransferase-like isoform X2 [Protopterus annectens]|uniref:histamine N-methyltransferase-like isoform X2 n=1 Tax=Protopterus annectens TaxID=7888 RepID=UPI001CFAA928|nr:histamine N-methyltransferase-like isoform X2 [Protopterus annectens]
MSENMDKSSSMRSLFSDHSRYVKSFQLFLDRSTEHQCMQEFINKELPDILSRIGNGNSSINVLGIGSGSGEVDLQMLRKVEEKHPEVHINNDIVEPSAEHVMLYKELVSRTPDLQKMSFKWNKMTSSEYEKQMKEENEKKKWDFIHMIQVLYYVESIEETIKFCHQHLEKNGKIVIILVSGNSGWASLWKKYGSRLPLNDICNYITSRDVKEAVDRMGLKCQHYDLPSIMDITECFIDGNEEGELLVDFLTETLHFSKTAPPSFKSELMEYLKQPECSTRRDDKIVFNNTLGAIVVEPLF